MGDARTIHKLKAKICEQAERYDDMVKEMKELVKGSIFYSNRLLNIQ
jgi:cell division protein FtsL